MRDSALKNAGAVAWARVISPRFIIGFSGHRSLAHPAAVKAALYSTLEQLRDTARGHGGVLEFYGSAAYGSDLLALECARDLGIPIHLLLPMPEAQFAEDFAGHAAEWAQAREFIAAASRGENGGTFRVLRDHQPRPDCYHGQATRLTDACDLLLAVWNGQPAQGTGGTGEVIALARSLGRPVLTIPADTPAAVSPEAVVKAWPADEPGITELNEYLKTDAGLTQPITSAAVLQKALGQVADKKAPEFRRGIARAIKLHAVAALLGAVPSLFYLAFVHDPARPTTEEMARWESWAKIFIAAELVLVLASLIITWLIQHRKVQPKWLRTRFATELVRGLRASQPWLDPLHPQVVRHLPQHHRLALTASLLAARESSSTASLASMRASYLTERLQDQIRHFKEKGAKAAHQNHLWHGIATWAGWLAPVSVLFALTDKVADWHLTHSWAGAFFGKFLPVALPLLAGVAASLRHALDLTRRTHRYPEMAERLTAIAATFPLLQSRSTIAAAVSRTEELLLDELIEWHLAAQNAGAH